ncbi:MAG: hypothetical protein METHP_01981 [Methanoregula sp. SKADARSKE-2]|nr:MAG: hypothetical protein METHP_01981 [Methanoregula sp. SKADARSKE-2]
MAAAESSDLVLLEERDGLGSLEPAIKEVCEIAGAFDPLAEDLAPCTLSPTGVGDRKAEMAEWISVVMEDHLGLAGCTGGEGDQHRVAAPGLPGVQNADRPVGDRSGIEELVREALPALLLVIRNHPGSGARALIADLLGLTGVFQIGDDHPEFPDIGPVLYVPEEG